MPECPTTVSYTHLDVYKRQVQNPFSMGYLAVMNAANILSGKKTESVIKTDVYVVDRSNMYSADVQKILFGFDKYD